MVSRVRNIFNYRILRFLLTGGIAFLVEYITFIFLAYLLESNLIVANIISFSAGLITSFLINKNWVFNNPEKSNKQFLLYLALALINLSISTIAISVLSNIIEPAITKIIAVTAIAIWNYFIYKKIIFSYK